MRWHGEQALMFRRWKEEMRSHGYDWRNPPTDSKACHCAKGIGSMRKHRPHECPNGRDCICKLDKRKKARLNTKLAAIQASSEA